MQGVPKKIPVKILRIHPEAYIPKYEHLGDSGADVYSIDDYVLQPFERKAFATGISLEIPLGFEVQVRPKSGLALTNGITVLNTPGTIDSGYRGEVKVILINLGTEPYHIKKGQKIAQLVVAPVIFGNFIEVNNLSDSERGNQGFGSTNNI
jgi:dUTP pyrophosphatase